MKFSYHLVPQYSHIILALRTAIHFRTSPDKLKKIGMVLKDLDPYAKEKSVTKKRN